MKPEIKSRIYQSVETALNESDGMIIINVLSDELKAQVVPKPFTILILHVLHMVRELRKCSHVCFRLIRHLVHVQIAATWIYTGN